MTLVQHEAGLPLLSGGTPHLALQPLLRFIFSYTQNRLVASLMFCDCSSGSIHVDAVLHSAAVRPQRARSLLPAIRKVAAVDALPPVQKDRHVRLRPQPSPLRCAASALLTAAPGRHT